MITVRFQTSPFLPRVAIEGTYEAVSGRLSNVVYDAGCLGAALNFEITGTEWDMATKFFAALYAVGDADRKVTAARTADASFDFRTMLAKEPK
jgi:hypothetical protein